VNRPARAAFAAGSSVRKAAGVRQATGVTALLLALAGVGPSAAQGTSALEADSPPAGVENAQRAWQHWTLNCQGCHRQDGSGSPGTAPGLAGTVARFLSVPGGREYLGRVPGVATSPLSDADLAEVMNWMLWRFDREHIPVNFQPFTAAEVGALRQRPLRLEASQLRADLLQQAGEPRAP